MFRIVDLSLEIFHGFLPSPVHPPTSIFPHMTFRWTAPHFAPGCPGWESRVLVISDHCGTHLDAPFHFDPRGVTVEAVDLHQTIGPALRLDVTDLKSASEPVRREHLEKAVARLGERLTGDDIVLLRAWPKTFGEAGFEQSPGLAPDAVDWLLEIGVKAVGTNTFTIDDASTDDQGRPLKYAHTRLLQRGIPVIEHLINLERIDRDRFWFAALPLRLRGATGSPVRAVAILLDEE